MRTPNRIPFRVVRRQLKAFGIIWREDRGKGSDGLFCGTDRTGRPQNFTIGHVPQLKGLARAVVNAIRRRFGLLPPEVTDEQFWGDAFR